MKWFLDLTTRTKLLLGFGLMVVFLIIVILSAYSGIMSVLKSQRALYQEDFLPAIELVELRSDQNRARAQLLEMMMVKDRAKQRLLEKDIKERAKEVDEGLAIISESLENQPQELKKLNGLISIRAAYIKTRDEQVSLIYKGKADEAAKLGITVQEDRYVRIREITRELGDKGIARAKERIAQAEKNTKALAYAFVAVGAVASLLSILITFFFGRIIAKPLAEITSAAERISSGDLAVAVPSLERRDEVGSLTKAFVAMTGYLRRMAEVSKQVAGGDLTATANPVSDKDILGNAFADMITNLRKMSQEIRDGVNVLASSASEILASTTQVASGIAETSTSVTETTATVEEVRQTAQRSTEKSRSVSENAQKVVSVARQGDAAVTKTVEGINHIRELMESVAESIVKLSEQAQTIGEIITAVNDLAQQSNLLSVNAAIEASKAGEHGKGFSVVAQEIKSLADQSKQATEQVRTILGDIQKATNSAVMAAEQVSKAVDAGVKQAAESGESIKRLTESITESVQVASQIAASSQQQFAGMDQIVLAMESIKKAAQQNMAGTKQTELAAHSLNEFGQKLKEMVGMYKV